MRTLAAALLGLTLVAGVIAGPGTVASASTAGATSSVVPPSADALGTASLFGNLHHQSSISFDDEVLAGATVTAYQFAADQTVTFEKTATTASDGGFTIGGLAAGNYFVEFTAAPDGGPVLHDWYDSSDLHLQGTPISVAAGENRRMYAYLGTPIPITGHVSCEQCSSPPSPDSVTIEFAVWSSGYVTVASVTPAADGSYAFSLMLGVGGGNYAIFARHHGPGDFSALSGGVGFTASGGSAVQDVIVARDVPAHCRNGSTPGVHALYWDFLHRSPTEDDVQFWCSRAPFNDLSAVTESFVTSDEYRLIRIDAAYGSILGREAEPAGRLNWLNGMRANILTTDDIETTFYASDEYYQLHGSTDTGFASALYQTLLHRSGTASDYAFWAALVGQHSRAWVIHQFWDSTETISERVSAMYELYLGRVPDRAGLANWVGVALRIGDSGLRAGLSGNVEYSGRAGLRYHEVR